jgi:hypothetical protein
VPKKPLAAVEVWGKIIEGCQTYFSRKIWLEIIVRCMFSLEMFIELEKNTAERHDVDWRSGCINTMQEVKAKRKALCFLHDSNLAPGTQPVYKASSVNWNYHVQINYDNLSKWIFHQAIPNLSSSRAIIMDNVTYHGKEHNRASGTSTIIVCCVPCQYVHEENHIL